MPVLFGLSLILGLLLPWGQALPAPESGATLTLAEQKLLKREAELKWSKRVNRENLEEALSKWEFVAQDNPSDYETLVSLTRGFYLLADAHVENPELKQKYFEKAAAYGKMALSTHTAYREKIEKGHDLEEGVELLGQTEVAAMYWTAVSLRQWSLGEGFFSHFRNKDAIRALIKRVQALRPDFFYQAAPRFWACFYAESSSLSGGDMGQSKAEFDKSIEMAPEYLGTSVLMAQMYYVKKGDKKAFEEMLKAVLQSNQDNHPDIGPENALEKRKAERLLEKKDDLF